MMIKKSSQPSKAIYLAISFALLHLILGLIYASITPFMTGGILKSQNGQVVGDIGAPDERAHLDYVTHILSGKGLPYLNVNRMLADKNYREDDYENHQPPLFYALDAVWAKTLGGSVHPNSNDGWKFRSLNCLIGAGTVLAVFFVALETFQIPILAILACGIVALLPMNTALSGAVSNDPLLIFFSTWILYLSLKSVTKGWSFQRTFAIGALLGLAFLTKSSGLTFIFVPIGAALMPQEQKVKIKWVCAAIGIFLILAAPVLIRNQHLYGDPLALHAFNLAFKDTATPHVIHQVIRAQGGSPTVGYWINWVGWWTARSFVGVFGYMDIWLNESGLPYASSHAPNTLYRVSLAVLAILSIGWILSLKTDWQKRASSLNAIHGILLSITVLVFIKFNMQYFQAQARYLMPAIGSIATGLAAGAIFIASSGNNLQTNSELSGADIVKSQSINSRIKIVSGIIIVSLIYLQIVAIQRIEHGFYERTMNEAVSYRYSIGENIIKKGAWCQQS